MGSPTEYTEVDKQSQYQEVKDRPVHISVAGPLLPLVIQQAPRPGNEPDETWWLSKSQRAPAYLDLLYDLAIAAVLSVSGDKHELMSAQSMLAYFSYFIITCWVWASQCLYDSRYQSNDWLHRLFKLLQLASFTYISAVGGSKSFNGVALAYAVSRILLAVQYMYITCVTQKRARRERLQSFLIPIVTLLISALCWIIAGLLPLNAIAKLVLAYGALGAEVVVTLGSGHLKRAIAPAAGLLAERFADLTLVILAEGVLGLVKTLADVVSGFGLAAGGRMLPAYSECFCSLIIVFVIWHFIFHAFNPEERFKSRKLASAWAFFHLPLHFVILLVLSSMKNVAVYENVGGALNVLVPIFNQALNNTGETADYKMFDAALTPDEILQFHKLNLQPTFITEINLLNQQYLTAADNTDDLPDFDPYVDAMQYGAQVCMEVAKTYEITFTQMTTEAYANLSNVERSWSTNDTQLHLQESLAYEWYN
ncbi:hypothetical protein CALCODRAFT_486185 [Calocera cornea HHB12733]|uniref:Low temperature requirement A n=1 Tax=Calocera cornea HHB12733 TaxID=1353952 RepID=A0A165DVZ3_9BASI|nr:hypothetical protein CALCODRAFT_486185 [Calocera cornea HHB12733]